MKKKKISKLHVSLISLALLFGIFLGLVPVYFKTTQYVAAAPPAKRVTGTITITNQETCTTPTDTDFGISYCILSQVPLANPPANIECSWAYQNNDPSVNDSWHNCYSNGGVSSGAYGTYGLPSASETIVRWKNGNLEFGLQQGGTFSIGGTITLVYSAVSQ